MAALVLAGAGCTNEVLGVENALSTRHRAATHAPMLEDDAAGAWLGDVRFTDAERAAILEGVAWLHARAKLPPPPVVWAVLGASPAAKSIRRERGEYMGTRPVGLCQGETIYLDPEGRDDLAGIAAHEMGHCVLGFQDDPESEGIMHHALPMLWTDREEEQCRASSRCSR